MSAVGWPTWVWAAVAVATGIVLVISLFDLVTMRSELPKRLRFVFFGAVVVLCSAHTVLVSTGGPLVLRAVAPALYGLSLAWYLRRGQHGAPQVGTWHRRTDLREVSGFLLLVVLSLTGW